MPITPDINSIKVVGLALEYLSAYGIPKDKIFLVVNWTFMENGKDAEAIASLLNHPVRAILKHDSAWVEGVNFGIPLIMSGLKTPTIERLEIMAWNLSRPADRSRTPEDPSPSWLRMADLRKRQGPRS
jgi:MinD-like ATPase involved in chromosome partitioning or flagellar assembly